MNISVVFGLLLAILALSIIGTLYTNSPLAESIKQGAGLTQQYTDCTVEVENKKILSDLAMLSFHRATPQGCINPDNGDGEGEVHLQNTGELTYEGDLWGWSQGEYGDGGYPFLQDTYLTSRPACFGASGENFTESWLGDCGWYERFEEYDSEDEEEYHDRIERDLIVIPALVGWLEGFRENAVAELRDTSALDKADQRHLQSGIDTLGKLIDFFDQGDER